MEMDGEARCEERDKKINKKKEGQEEKKNGGGKTVELVGS